ncbi:MAG: ribosome assembly RNA-binding protein YhbY [Oxalobacter sp.]|nr:ribosome assembly RNA-binding protein YhbY [Oxalobacter sp.]
MLKLTSSQRSALKAKAHSLNPVVMIGDAGLTDAVLKEIDVNLNAHGLIKIRVFGDDRMNRIEILQQICSQLDAAPVQHIGKLLVIYRPKKETEKTVQIPAKNGLRTVVTFKPGSGAIRNRAKKVTIKGNERVTQGGLVKRRKTRQVSAKKKALAS